MPNETNDKSKFIAYANSIIDLSEVAYFHREVTPAGATLSFTLKSGQIIQENFYDEGLMNVEPVERMIYQYFGMVYPHKQ